jgi:DNA (cytosine-5)-methyltransferase 1
MRGKTDSSIFISLFAGCGGSSLGYTMAGFRELLAVEWDVAAAETFKLNFPGVPVYQGDIRNLSVEECLSLSGIEVGELDLLDGSPPCQGFSMAGKREIRDERNSLFLEYVRLLRGLKPKVFVMENVSGLVKGKMKLVFAEIMRELRTAGYNVKCRLLNAMWFGVPQSRERLIWLGTRDDLGVEPSFPKFLLWTPISVEQALQNIEALNFKQLTQGEKTYWMKAAPGEAVGKFHSRKKINPARPSPTQESASSHYHWAEPRTISIEEMKALQGFPPEFQMPKNNYRKSCRQIGNSVPPPFMKAIAEHIKDNILSKVNGQDHKDTKGRN